MNWKMGKKTSKAKKKPPINKQEQFGISPMPCYSCQSNKLLLVGIITGNLLLLVCDFCGMPQSIPLGDVKTTKPIKEGAKQTPNYTG